MSQQTNRICSGDDQCQFVFSVLHRNNCLIICNNHIAVQLICLESFFCTHKEIYFRVTIDDVEKVVCKECFKKHIKKHFQFLPYISF